jgi:SAM-dependent methyltransferase
MDWRRFWEEYPRKFGDTEFHKQVGRTANGGVPTPEWEVDLVVEATVRTLRLGHRDRLLDLCCGNGYLTSRLGRFVHEVVGMDFSESLLSIARRFHGGENIAYRQGSALELGAVLGDLPPFDKVCIIESLHYFQPDQLAPILDALLGRTVEGATYFLSGVTDVDRKRNFYDTTERWREHERRQAAGTDIMGHWWHRDEIARTAEAVGLQCQFLPQQPGLSTAHYRFDVLICRA